MVVIFFLMTFVHAGIIFQEFVLLHWLLRLRLGILAIPYTCTLRIVGNTLTLRLAIGNLFNEI